MLYLFLLVFVNNDHSSNVKSNEGTKSRQNRGKLAQTENRTQYELVKKYEKINDKQFFHFSLLYTSGARKLMLRAPVFWLLSQAFFFEIFYYSVGMIAECHGNSVIQHVLHTFTTIGLFHAAIRAAAVSVPTGTPRPHLNTVVLF